MKVFIWASLMVVFTPAFTVNDQIIIGPPPESVLVKLINEILAEN